jgi:hypothetical protein
MRLFLDPTPPPSGIMEPEVAGSSGTYRPLHRGILAWPSNMLRPTRKNFAVKLQIGKRRYCFIGLHYIYCWRLSIGLYLLINLHLQRILEAHNLFSWDYVLSTMLILLILCEIQAWTPTYFFIIVNYTDLLNIFGDLLTSLLHVSDIATWWKDVFWLFLYPFLFCMEVFDYFRIHWSTGSKSG